jgi:hypothetical protein
MTTVTIKRYLCCCSVLFVLTVGQVFAEDVRTDEWGAITNKMQMSISLKGDKKQIGTNQPFSLLIRIRNVSTNELFHGYYTYVNDYELSFVVIAPSGKDISPKFPKDRVAGSGAAIRVPPNQTKKFEFNLSYFCMLDKIGTYKIIAKQKGYLGTNQTPFIVISNPLYISVVPDQ